MRAFLTLSATCFLMYSAAGQEANPTKVAIPLLIQDFHHRPVLNVTHELLALTVDRKAVNDFNVIPSESVPLRLGILIDVSNSLRDRSVENYLKEARDFAFSATHSPDDRVFFGAFDTKTVLTPWLDHNSIQQVSTKLRAGGGTALYDAVIDACERMGMEASPNPVRRVLVVVSDGDDNQSHVTLRNTIDEVITSGTIVFAFDTNPVGMYNGGDRALDAIATSSGGESYSASGSDTHKQFERISGLLKGIYLISFVPVAQGAHQLDIKSVGNKKLRISFPRNERSTR